MSADARRRSDRAARVSARPYAKLKPGPGQSAEEVAADQRARIHRAMAELVAERGYEEIKVSELARRARVSTRTFYERSHGKQECLLETYDEIMHRATDRIAFPRAGEPDLRRTLAALADAVLEDPQAARLACVDASAAGLAVLDRMRDAEAHFEEIAARFLTADAHTRHLRPVLAKAMVSGLMQVFRARLISGREDELPALVDDLVRWTAGFNSPDIARLGALGDTRIDPSLAAAAIGLATPAEAVVDPVERERELILTATLELAVRDGYWRLTVPRIRGEAGLSRQRFDAHFDGVEECFVGSLESLFARLAHFVGEQSALKEDWAAGFHTGVAALCRYAASEPGLMRLALIDVFASGPQGLRHLSRLVAGTAERLRADVPAEQKPSPAIAEASMGAIWGVVGDCVAARHPQRLARLAPLFTFLALGPIVGCGRAADAIAQHATGPSDRHIPVRTCAR